MIIGSHRKAVPTEKPFPPKNLSYTAPAVMAW